MIFHKFSSSSIEFLKWIAILAMVIDHVAIILLNDNETLRSIGRIAFPLFGFILIHNFIYFTSDKVTYIKRLWLFAILSQPVFMLTVSSELNIFVLLATTLSIVYAFLEVNGSNRPKSVKYFAYGFLLFFGGIASLLSGYGFVGFYFLVSIYFAFKNFYFGLIALALLFVMNSGSMAFEVGALVSIFMLFMMRDFDIRVPRTNKWFFYAFYPLHLLLIYATSMTGMIVAA